MRAGENNYGRDDCERRQHCGVMQKTHRLLPSINLWHLYTTGAAEIPRFVSGRANDFNQDCGF
jgi:hypothetical protein